MNQLLYEKKNELLALCKQYKVKYLYSFGSVNTEQFGKDSDIDFLIAFQDGIGFEEYTENYFLLQYKLRDMFHRNIDLVTENSLSNPFFIKGIEKTKELIYGT